MAMLNNQMVINIPMYTIVSNYISLYCNELALFSTNMNIEYGWLNYIETHNDLDYTEEWLLSTQACLLIVYKI
jgi:hypothetical protein